jgi:hypothetical protein
MRSGSSLENFEPVATRANATASHSRKQIMVSANTILIVCTTQLAKCQPILKDACMSFVAPDWRNEFEYPLNDDSLNLSFWAWQFLRRNKEYQRDWSAYVAGLQAMTARIPELTSYVDFGSGTIKQDAPEPMISLANAQPEYALPNEGSGCISRLSEIGEKWGLCWLENPASPSLPREGGFLVEGGVLLSVALNNHHHGDTNYYTPVFDLRMSVDVLRSQFDLILKERDRCVKDRTLTLYPGRPERSRPLFSRYLRALDARDSNVPMLEIANVLLNQRDIDGAKTARNWFNAGNKIRNGDYRGLPVRSV